MENALPIFDCYAGDPGSSGPRWVRWKRAFELFVRAKDITDPERLKAMLLHHAGMGVQDIYFSIPNAEASVDEQNCYERAMRVLDEYFAPKVGVPHQRLVFRRMKQEANETVDEFVARLRLQGQSCKFLDLDDRIKDQVVAECSSDELRRQILEKMDVTLEDVCDLAHAFDSAPPDPARSEATFRYMVENFSKMNVSLFSPAFYVRNLPWKINVMPRTGLTNDQPAKFLGFYLKCKGVRTSASRICYATAELRILSNKEGQEPFSRKIEHLFNSEENDWGYSQFKSFQDILNIENGYIKDDSITLEVHIVADPPQDTS